MKLRFCVICGTNKNLEHHHIKPIAMGGTDHQHNFLTLCTEHHAMIHQIKPGYWNEMRRLQKRDFVKHKNLVSNSEGRELTRHFKQTKL